MKVPKFKLACGPVTLIILDKDGLSNINSSSGAQATGAQVANRVSKLMLTMRTSKRTTIDEPRRFQLIRADALGQATTKPDETGFRRNAHGQSMMFFLRSVCQPIPRRFAT